MQDTGIYFTAPTLKEESMNIKSSSEQPGLEDFKASEGQLDKWELTDGIFEKQLSEESLDVSKTAKELWVGRLSDLHGGYDLENIWTMDKSGCFFKSLQSKVLTKK